MITARLQYEKLIEKHYRFNYRVIAAVEGIWGLGLALVSHVAILPVFLSALGASPFVIGLLPATFQLFFTAPQLLGARFTRDLPLKKYVLTVVHYPGCLLLFVLAALVPAWHAARPDLLVGATLVWLALYGLTISFAMPMWVNLMAKLFPPRVRGRSFSVVFLLGSVAGAVGSLVAGKILGWIPFPNDFVILFIAAGALLSACITSFFWLREPEPPPDMRPRTRFLHDLSALLRRSPGFKRFLLARVIGTFSLMAVAFYTVAGIERFELPSAAAGQFGAVLLLGQTFGALVAGRLGDRVGFRLVTALAIAADVAAALVALVAPSQTIYVAVFFLFGFHATCSMIGMHNLAIEFCPFEDKTTVIALCSTVLCPVLVFAPTIGGLLAMHHPAGYSAVFAVSLAGSIPALLLMLFCVPEPRRKSE